MKWAVPLIGAMLASGQPPLPDPAALLAEVRANQHKLDAVRENYTFHLIRRIDQLDKNGTILKSESFEREVFFVNGRRIGRLVKRNGKDLTPSEDKAEHARVARLVDAWLRAGPPAHGMAARVNEISDILAVVTISNPRRVSLKGRDTLAYDFSGDPRARAHGMEQNTGKKMAGTIWFDEADHQLARVEIRFADSFHIGGGVLASVQKGTTLEFEQSPVGDGLWMQTSSAEHLDARLVVKKFREDVRTEAFDFKKFNAQALGGETGVAPH